MAGADGRGVPGHVAAHHEAGEAPTHEDADPRMPELMADGQGGAGQKPQRRHRDEHAGQAQRQQHPVPADRKRRWAEPVARGGKDLPELCHQPGIAGKFSSTPHNIIRAWAGPCAPLACLYWDRRDNA